MTPTRLLILALALFSFSHTRAQISETDLQRYISVTGSAEVVVQPDEIELEITLKEYDHLASLKRIENRFIDILEKNKISIDKLVFSKSDYYWYSWWTYRNHSYKEKTYKVKLDVSTDFLSLVKDLDIKGVHALRISDTSNKELQTLRKEIKISALKAAKEKASYLLESIDEKLGKALAIDEVPAVNHYWRGNQNLLSNVVIDRNSSSSELAHVSEIKLRYEVKAKFGIL